MIEKLNSKIRPLLEIYDRLKDVLKIAKINPPIIATCGMQSHGKSSTLESITKIELPIKAETCTICPIKICLRELTNKKDKPYYRIKIENEDFNENDKYLTNFKKLKDKIDEYQDKVRESCKLEGQKITADKVIQLDVFKTDIPNLNLYDLPGVTFVEGIKDEAEKIYDTFLEDKETTVLLILNGGDDLTNSSVIQWMRKVKDYKNRFIPIVVKADLIKNFEGKFKQLKGLELNHEACLIINKCKDIKELRNLSDKDEVKKIKEVIPNISNFPVNIGRKKLINVLIKIQYEKYKENFKDIIDKIKKEIKVNQSKLENCPNDYDLKEDFCDSFIDIFEKHLKQFNELIKKFKKGPEDDLLKYEIQQKYKIYIEKSKEKVNEFLTLDFCNYVTKNIKQTNSDKITILEDEIPFKLLITPKINEILKIFDNIIKDIYDLIIKNVEKDINTSFGDYKNLENKVKELYEAYTKSQYDKMQKFYKEICLLETRNITSFDLELNYKCNVLVRKILNFIYKKIEILKKIEKDDDEENNINNPNDSKGSENNIKTDIYTITNMSIEITNNIFKENNNEDNNEVYTIVDTSDNTICDYRGDIIKGIKNINYLSIKSFQKLTKETINKLYEEVETNPNFKKNVKDRFREYKSHIMQIVGIINNYEIEQLTRIYDSLGCKGRPKLSYTPENITTFDERIEEDIKIDKKDEYEFIPGFQFIKNKNLNDFINFYKSGEVIPKTANTIVKMVSYAEVMCTE